MDIEEYESTESNKFQAINEDDLKMVVNSVLKKLSISPSKKELAAFITGIREGYAFAMWDFKNKTC